MRYEPKTPPVVNDPDLQRVLDYVKEELAAIQQAGGEQSILELRVLHQAPAKPREGMIVAADGTDWDPGNGAGQYRFEGGVWVQNGNAVHTHVLADILDAGTIAALDEIGLGNIQDITANRVLGRGSPSGIPEELTLTQVLDFIGSAARGDILVRGAAAWARLAIGAASTILTSDGTDPSWGPPPGFELLTTLSTASGPRVSYTGIPSTIKELYIEFENISFTANAVLAFALSGDNGANYGALISCSSSTGSAAGILSGILRLSGVQLTGLTESCGGYYVGATSGGGYSNFCNGAKHATGGANAVNAIQFESAGVPDFDGGTIRIYGLK